jgi:hypothetical protein
MATNSNNIIAFQYVLTGTPRALSDYDGDLNMLLILDKGRLSFQSSLAPMSEPSLQSQLAFLIHAPKRRERKIRSKDRSLNPKTGLVLDKCQVMTSAFPETDGKYHRPNQHIEQQCS